MPTANASRDVDAVYSSTDLVVPHLAPHTIDGILSFGNSAQNPIKADRIQNEIVSFSRQFDGLAAGLGIRTPLPGIGATNPDTPEPAKRWVTLRVAAQCQMWAASMNRKAPEVEALMMQADEILRVKESGEIAGSILADAMIEFVYQEEFETSTLDGGGQELGELGSTGTYRLRNRGLIVDAQHPLKFLDSSNKEIFDTAGIPYGRGRGFKVINADQSVIALLNETDIRAKAAYVSYYFTWRDRSFYCYDDEPIDGVANYVPTV